jgi:hypothetical protein
MVFRGVVTEIALAQAASGYKFEDAGCDGECWVHVEDECHLVERDGDFAGSGERSCILDIII